MTSASAREKARKAALDAIDAYLPDDAAQFVSASTLSDAAIDAYEVALKAAGYVMVPREPTEAMLKAAYLGQQVSSVESLRWTAQSYSAMIEAAPNPAP